MSSYSRKRINVEVVPGIRFSEQFQPSFFSLFSCGDGCSIMERADREICSQDMDW
ncbi:hypothetical protein BDW69DRAFT_46123 [Aspergillus filifer]